MTLKIHIMLRIHHKVRAPLVVRYVHGLRTVGFFPVLPERTRCLWLRVTSTTTAVRPVGRTPSSGSRSWSCSLPTTQVQRAVGGRRRSPSPTPPAPVKPLHSSASSFAAVENFVLIPQHTSPDFALEETDALYDVVQDVRSRWNTNVSAL